MRTDWINTCGKKEGEVDSRTVHVGVGKVSSGVVSLERKKIVLLSLS